jgi:hypothetical protein
MDELTRQIITNCVVFFTGIVCWFLGRDYERNRKDRITIVLKRDKSNPWVDRDIQCKEPKG